MGVLLPSYWYQYGPSNYLWFSDLALFAGLAALWLRNSLLASMAALAVLLLEIAWLVDVLAGLFGFSLVGLGEYMFDDRIPPFIRGLSLFHVRLPWALMWMICRFGYHRRALGAQTALAWIVLPATYFLTDPSDNINWVFGLGDEPQTSMPPLAYLGLLMLSFPLLVYVPSHYAQRALTRRICRQNDR